MYNFILIASLLLTFSAGQDRSMIFNAGPPIPSCDVDSVCDAPTIDDLELDLDNQFNCESYGTCLFSENDSTEQFLSYSQCCGEDGRDCLVGGNSWDSYTWIESYNSSDCLNCEFIECNLIEDGYLLSNNGDSGTVIADRFFVSSDYVLEAFYVWLKLVESDSGSVNVKLHQDSNGIPGDIIYSWDITLDPNDTTLDDYLVTTVGECHTMLGGNNHWLSVTVNEPNVQVLWGNSPNQFYFASTSEDLGNTWELPTQDFVGSTKIFAEEIFYSEEFDVPSDLGDVTYDGVVNILDIVQTVNYILGQISFEDNQILQADFNEDNSVDILDIVQIVNYVLSNSSQFLPNFTAEDINPASEYFGQLIGPETFLGDISCYYFGKGG